MGNKRINRVRRVDIIIYPGFKAIEATGVVSVFEYANARLIKLGCLPAYELQLCAPDAGMIPSDTIVKLEATKALSQDSLPDTALIVGARDIHKALLEQPYLVEWCRNIGKYVSTLAGICTGAFFLAEAGLLDGHSATTHWSASDTLRLRYPSIDVTEDAIFVQSGNIWTSAGVTAALDLALAIVERDLGKDIALSVAQDLVVFLKRPGGQSQYSQHLSSQMTQHDGVREIQGWILNNLDKSITVNELSMRAAMSTRNFVRVFHREAHCSPSEFIERSRIELAQRLLEEGVNSFKQVADRCGFSSDDHLRRVFRRRCGMTPKEYLSRHGK
ncbi:GlxA family transcriptional regulator [Klebsiella pneumoniae]|uniref:GlxA family transcriptional regulator n=1 Tax=Klebsiella pneumoniae TaxID=573 RepID=UPI002962225B|nr:helix-turn-helix domain-containing protein [Klebsiella pneumoniae]MDW1257618.1 helix-turn-helix domain-containing protein [Klebsiella pneumoniae]